MREGQEHARRGVSHAVAHAQCGVADSEGTADGSAGHSAVACAPIAYGACLAERSGWLQGTMAPGHQPS